jgi:hypothetical protein
LNEQTNFLIAFFGLNLIYNKKVIDIRWIARPFPSGGCPERMNKLFYCIFRVNLFQHLVLPELCIRNIKVVGVSTQPWGKPGAEGIQDLHIQTFMYYKVSWYYAVVFSFTEIAIFHSMVRIRRPMV